MNLRAQLWILFLAPIALFAAALLLGWTIPVPELGRGYVLRFALPEAGQPIDLPDIEGPQDATRPLVVIDAGHGGRDPGAVASGLQEKDLTLALAMALKDELLAGGGVRVALTRDTDNFLVLLERNEIARRLDADLFVSIHADAADAEEASGATVYTRSEQASDAQAARFAARENRADTINGVDLSAESDAVSDILMDLSRRRTREGSGEMSALVVREGQGRMPFRERPELSAPLAVLRSPDLPSVLIEAGYISNETDAARIASPAGRRAFAESMAQAIRVFFARQSNREG